MCLQLVSWWRGDADVLRPRAVGVGDLPAHVRGPDDQGHGLGQRLVPGVALASLGLERVLAEERLLTLDRPPGLVQRHEHRHLRAEDARVERLHQEVHRSLGVPPQARRRVVRVGGQEDDRRLVSGGAHPEQPRGLEPVEHRHLHVEDDDRELLLRRQGERPGAGGGLHQAELEPVQDGREREEVVGVVVDEQDARAHRRIVRGQVLRPCTSGACPRDHPVRAIGRRGSALLTFVHGPPRVVTDRGGCVRPRPAGSPGAGVPRRLSGPAGPRRGAGPPSAPPGIRRRARAPAGACR